jgi:hypothetical protein
MAYPAFCLGRPAGPGQAGQRRIQPGIASRGRIPDHYPARLDVDAANGGQLDELGTHQAVVDLLFRHDAPAARTN